MFLRPRLIIIQWNIVIAKRNMSMLSVLPAVTLSVLLTTFALTAAADTEVAQKNFENQLTEQQR
jgi:hypothetical protein